MRESDFLKRKPNFQQDFYAQTLVFLLYFLGAWILLFGTHLAGMWTDLFSPLDSLFYSYPTKLFSAHLPLWNDRISIGSPAFTDPEFQSFYPPALLIFNLLPAPLSYHLFLMIHYAAAGFFTYRFMRVQGLGGISCFWGGVVFEFCGFLTAHKLHINMICAGIYLPVVLLAIERMRQTNRFKYAAYTAIGFALSILAGYPQITLYMAFVSFAYGLWRSLDLPPAQRNVLIGFVHFAFILGVVLSAIQILPTIQLFKLATRESISYRYFSMYSFGLQNLPQLIFPFLYGGGYSNSGFNLALGAVGMIETAGYAGILPPLLAVLGLIVCWKSTPQVRFWSVLAVLSFLLVLGVSTPLYGLLYHVPMVNLFRGPARNWYECHFAIAVLSSFGLDSLLNKMDTNHRFAQKATMIFAATCLGAVLILILAVLTISKLPDSHSIFTWMNVTNVALARANLEMGSPAVLIPLILLTLSAGWLFLLSKKTLKFLPALG
ncbi:MAG TPA: hypothetical protein VFG11_06680, partial [Acidobacteriota bacterium]|nr:hypothetical protein [Acidobacteriota bacterium]